MSRITERTRAQRSELEKERSDELGLPRGEKVVAKEPGFHIQELPLLPQLRDVLLENNLGTIGVQLIDQRPTIIEHEMANRARRGGSRLTFRSFLAFFWATMGVALPVSAGLGLLRRRLPPHDRGHEQQEELHDRADVDAIAADSRAAPLLFIPASPRPRSLSLGSDRFFLVQNLDILGRVWACTSLYTIRVGIKAANGSG